METPWTYAHTLIRLDCNDHLITVGINNNHPPPQYFIYVLFWETCKKLLFFNSRSYIVIIYLLSICLHTSFSVKKTPIIFELEIFVHRPKTMNKKRHVRIVLFLIFWSKVSKSGKYIIIIKQIIRCLIKNCVIK